MEGFGFTPLDLERALVQDVTSWVNNPPILCRNPYDPTGPHIPPTVYQGRIPSVQAGPTTTPTYKAPSIAIGCTSMHYKREKGEGTVCLAILTWDDDLSRNGYADVSNIINRIIERLFEKRSIADSFILLDDAVHGEVIFDPSVDFFGYFLGSIEAKFGLFTPGVDPGGPYFPAEDYLAQ